MGVSQKKRGVVNRKRASIILMQFEGKNKTEKYYFQNFNIRNKNYRIIFTKGHYTDPINMIENLLREVEKEGLSVEDGDKAFCVFDTDTDILKQQQIEIAYSKCAKNPIVEIIKSNPCFEIWFLLHFKFSTKMFNSSDEVINELKGFISEYEKNKDYYDSIIGNIETAILNAKRIEKHHLDLRKRFK